MESIQHALAALLSGNTAEKAAAIARLHEQLRAVDAAQAITAIRLFLKSGQDAATGEPFYVGEKGELAKASTLRVALLDLLGQLSRETGTGDAVEIAREIFLSKKSADEWALSLRNLAWHDGASRELTERFSEMIHYQPWLAEPTQGMAEALDVPVFARDAPSIPALSEFQRLPRGSLLKRASGIALDRLSEAAPLEVMSYLNAHPEVMADKPRLRADYFTKADLANPEQRLAVETYLGRTDVSQEEKSKFIAGLAAPGSFTTPALLTPARVVPRRTDRRATVLEVASQWRQSGRYPALDAALADLIARKQAP